MENLRKAIDAIGNKESVLFKEAISDELVRRLRESLLKNQAETANHILVSEVNVGAPSAPPSTSPSKKMVAPQSPAAGVETAMEGDEELMKELQAAFGLGVKADTEKPIAKDDDISLDPNFEKEYLSKSLSLDGHKIQLKQIGLGLSKPVRVYVDGQRWELFPGPESAMKALKPYLKELDAEKLKKNEGA